MTSQMFMNLYNDLINLKITYNKLKNFLIINQLDQII